MLDDLLAREVESRALPSFISTPSLVELMSRLDQLPHELVHAASKGLRSPLRHAIEDLDRHGALSPRSARDLRTVFRRLACVAESLRARESERHLSDTELAVRYVQVDVADLVRSAAAPFARLAEARDVTFEIAALRPVYGEVDASKMERVFVSLLFNAFKYTPRGGAIHGALREDDVAGEVLFRITDSGPSVPRSLSESLFDRSRHIDRSSFVSVEGKQLCLGGSRDLVALHGGSLILDLDQPIGAAFEVRLPTRAPRGIAVPPGSTPEGRLADEAAEIASHQLRTEDSLGSRTVAAGGRALVLVVDDSRSIQRVLVSALEPDYATASAFDGERGLEMALTLDPDLIVVDTFLPGMDGEVLIREIRGRTTMASIPILALTSSDRPGQLIRLLEEGAQDVLRKPFETAELRARVRNLVSAKQTRDVLNQTVGQHETNLLKLAAEVGRRQNELECALDELDCARGAAEAANRTKSNFLRMMSHELKTPVTAMQLHMRLLERNPLVRSTPGLSDGLDRIGRCSWRLLYLVDTILEWARVESGRCQISVEPFDLVDLLSELVGELRGHIGQKRVVLELCAPDVSGLAIASDRRLVKLLLTNVIDRAVQITEQGRVRILLRSGGHAHVVSVQDGARPIRPDEVPQIFEPLGVAHDLHRASGAGSGLGLHVVRDIARAVSGEVELEPYDAGGNLFSLRLPTLSHVPVHPRTHGEG